MSDSLYWGQSYDLPDAPGASRKRGEKTRGDEYAERGRTEPRSQREGARERGVLRGEERGDSESEDQMGKRSTPEQKEHNAGHCANRAQQYRFSKKTRGDAGIRCPERFESADLPCAFANHQQHHEEEDDHHQRRGERDSAACQALHRARRGRLEFGYRRG